MRFLRFIFGRFTVIFLSVIVQVAFFVALFSYLQQVLPVYFFANIVVVASAVIIVIRLINSGTNPDYIVPWIVIILALPLTGIVIYLMFSKNHLSKSQKRLYASQYQSVAPYLTQNPDAKSALNSANKHMFGQSEYLYKSSKMPLYANSPAQYFGSGEEFFESLKEEIKRAEKFIFLEFFIIEQGIMFDSILELLVQKVACGVEVRLMYDDIGSIATVGINFCKKIRKLGIKCVKFSRFLPFVSAVHNNRDHRKIVVIDGKVGFVTGANLADEYINKSPKKFKAFWKDSAVMVKGDGVKSLTAMFLTGFNVQTKSVEDCAKYFPQIDQINIIDQSSQFQENQIQESQIQSPQIQESQIQESQIQINQGEKINQVEQEQIDQKNQAGQKEIVPECGFIQPFADAPLPLKKVSQNVLLNLINQAKTSVYITTPYLIIDYQLSQAIIQASNRGVDVRIVAPKIPDKQIIFLMTRASFPALISEGVKIYQFTPGFIHAKNILCDNETALVGSINLDYRSLVHHFECGVWMYKTPAVAQIAQDFDQIFSESELLTYQKSRLKLWQRLIKSVLQFFAPLL